MGLMLAALMVCCGAGPRSERLLDGEWQFRRDDQAKTTWKTVTLPCSMQSHEGTDWHGIGWYRKQLGRVNCEEGRRVLVHVTAAATFAEVYWNGTKVGEHLGGWTPFRCDVTELIRKQPDADHELMIKVDERVGHNTQGFLPIIQPHFGGLWQSIKLLDVPGDYIDDLRAVAPADVELPIWSPKEPKLKQVELSNAGGDRVSFKTAKRTVEARGTKLLLNGEPLQVRGVLNWGYYPPNLAPNPPEEVWRADIRRIKQCGFNLMKCCLWAPPQRLLEIADEEGMLIWMEYPTWHPQLTQKHLPDLRREFEEFFAHVRNHPCVILHSLTCETGPSADIEVIKDLTARCKAMIPGAIVEDDSSWIEWNRVTDFYDDHPYGNNHTWVKKLEQLRDYRKLGVKPLLLGEAIAADTWTRGDPFLCPLCRDTRYWRPHHLYSNAAWLKEWRDLGWPIDENQLIEDSKRYAMLMRKYQIETFRREVPDGGYVVSVIRDFPLAAMGLVDYEGKEKWPPDKWWTVGNMKFRANEWYWHGDTMLTLKTQQDWRSFSLLDRVVEGTIVAAGPVPPNAKVKVAVSTAEEANKPISTSAKFRMKAPDVTSPTLLRLKAVLSAGRDHNIDSDWPLWVIPNPLGSETGNAEEPKPDVIVAHHLDEDLLDKLKAGARVLLLPDNQPGSPPLQSHWFLRGGPVIFNHPALKNVPREMLVDLQHFDLAGPVISNISYIAEIDPIVMLWDNHDMRETRTHALAYATRVGDGRLLVSALNPADRTNPAAQWLRAEFMRYLREGPAPRAEMSRASIVAINRKLTEKNLELGGERKWKFQPDPKDEGIGKGWHKQDFDASQWADIKIDSHWESQGYPTLDGWAWYRLKVNVPQDFAGKDVYLRFTGVDDYYDVYVNGTKAGSGGDIPTKTTAFDETKSHKITALAKPGESITIAVRVYDWYGAGGIFRPVTLTTSPDDGKAPAWVK